MIKRKMITTLIISLEMFELYEEELVEWRLNHYASHKLSELPTSTKTIKTHSKVEVFTPTANDLKYLVPIHARAASATKAFAHGVIRHLN
jgi:hypothetical protein